MGILVYGIEYGIFSMWRCMVSSGGSISWVLGWLFLVRVGVRYRLLWFLGLGWPRGVGMVRKWKWYLLTENTHRLLSSFLFMVHV